MVIWLCWRCCFPVCITGISGSNLYYCLSPLLNTEGNLTGENSLRIRRIRVTHRISLKRATNSASRSILHVAEMEQLTSLCPPLCTISHYTITNRHSTFVLFQFYLLEAIKSLWNISPKESAIRF